MSNQAQLLVMYSGYDYVNKYSENHNLEMLHADFFYLF